MRASRIWLAALVVCALSVPAAAAGAADERIERSRDALRAARAAERAVAAELDAAAAAYERAHAHAQRLAAEQADTARTVADTRAAAAAADRVLRERVLLLYTNPGIRAAPLDVAADGHAVGETLHRLDLIEQLTRRGAEARRTADRAVERVRAAEHEHQVVRAGVRDAVRRRRQDAAELQAALQRAERRVERARARLRETERTVAAERRARRRAMQRAQRMAADGGAPLPGLDGKTCPVGAPNAFTDSWGAPRSGGRSHEGVDMFAAYGTPLYAVADGTVRVGHSPLGGLSIHLTTGDGDRYYYAHLSQTAVTSGQRVRGGQHVGATGNSGNARGTPPHLHWQYHPGGGAPVNPFPLAVALCRS